MSSVAAMSQMSMIQRASDFFNRTVGKNSETRALAAAAVLVTVLPFEMEHLFTMFVGALVYLLVHVMQPATRRSMPPAKAKKVTCEPLPLIQRSAPYRPPVKAQKAPASPTSSEASSSPSNRPEVRTQSVMPVQAPVFNGCSWDDDVAELLEQISPTAACREAVAKIAVRAKEAIESHLPGVEVLSIASGNIEGGKAFGVAVPDFDLVAKVKPEALAERAARSSEDKVIKNLLRFSTERLVGKAGLKFRRSAFKGDEPKVTLLAPAGLVSSTAVPINFSINTTTPINNAKLLSQCGEVDPRASALILLVRRWAKDRGISHAAKGHFSAYEWSLLAIFFMQVGMEDADPLLPPVKDLAAGAPATNKGKTEKSVGQLFCDFFRFYTSSIKWESEAINVHDGCRSEQLPARQVHRVQRMDGAGVDVAPFVQDPFDTKRNLGAILTPLSLSRFNEELQRAKACLASGASLAELLEPWAPAETEAADGN
eukprot:TRINITY_DN5563_c0_g1_i1.p1 TRINITY_DN5563_c0_g1~~TRINITY_DN5563_c0_g1_i1.p1  ORF type:complete len:484 (+),score=127.89 TRINITY_DN5563_c0_g1_i1:93-1544(+)